MSTIRRHGFLIAVFTTLFLGGGGGGGSSFAEACATSVAHTQGAPSGNGQVSITW